MVQPNVQQQNLDTSLLGLDGGGNMMDGIQQNMDNSMADMGGAMQEHSF